MKTFTTLIALLYSSLLMSQDCARQLTSFVMAPGGYAIQGSAILAETAGVKTLAFSSDFSTTAGPDLYIYLATKNESPTAAGNVTFELAILTSESGVQSYTVPAQVGMDDYDYVLIHCKQYDHFWGGGLLDPIIGTCTTSQGEVEEAGMSFGPNPFSTSTNFRFKSVPTGPVTIELFTLDGRLVRQETRLPGRDVTFSRNELEPGMYLVRVRSTTALLFQGKMIAE